MSDAQFQNLFALKLIIFLLLVLLFYLFIYLFFAAVYVQQQGNHTC